MRGSSARGIEDALIRVTRGDGDIDIIYAGAIECVHCRNFVADDEPGAGDVGWGELVAYAEAAGLDLAHMPLAMSSRGIVMATVEACAAPSSALSASERVEASYRGMEQMDALEKRVVAVEGQGEDAVRKAFVEGLLDVHSIFEAAEPFDIECYLGEGGEISDAMGRFQETFGAFGTPSFFLVDGGGAVRQFSGAGGVAAMIEELGAE